MAGQNSQSDNLRGEVTNFGKQIDFSKDLTEGDINGYIAWRIAIWEDSQYRDRELWIAFIDDFDDFKKDTFDIASKDYRSKLRDYLRANGVFVRKQPRLSIVNELYNVLTEEEQHKWTKEEIEGQVNSFHGFNSILKSRLPAILTTPATTTTIPAPLAAITTTIPAPPTAVNTTPAAVTTTTPAPPAVVTTTISAPPTAATAIPAPPSATTITGHGRELGNPAKTYEDKMKYGGVMDTFNHGKADIVNYELGEKGQGNGDILLDELDLHNNLETLILETDSPHNDPDPGSDQFITTFGVIDGRDVLANLADQSTYHILTKDINTRDDDPFAYATGAEDTRYTRKELYGIMINTGASNWSIAGYGQYMAYKEYDNIEFDIDSHPMHGKSPGR